MVVAVSLASLGTVERASGDGIERPPPSDRTVAATTTAAAESAPPSIATPEPTGKHVVTSVTDGDTVVLDDGRRVRLSQVDAPETYQCYGSESTSTLTELVGGKTVTLRRPADAPKTDRYGRTLAELYVDGVSADEELIRRGAAEWYEQYAHEDADLARRLSAAEREASDAGRGLWSACYGGGGTPLPPPPPPPAPAPAAPPAPPTTAAAVQGFVSTGNSSCHPGYPDDCIPPGPPDLDCGSASVRRRVHVDHAFGDPHGFDRDRDGWGCESYG